MEAGGTRELVAEHAGAEIECPMHTNGRRHHPRQARPVRGREQHRFVTVTVTRSVRRRSGRVDLCSGLARSAFLPRHPDAPP